MTLKTRMTGVTAAAAGGTVLCSLLYGHFSWEPLLSLAITAGTIFYHFAMRLAVGAGFNARMHNHADFRRPWYLPRPWEPALYKRLRVRRWKRYLPTYAPETFDPALHSLEELAQATCQAEVIHESIAVLSFLPLLAIPWFGAWPVFLLTSLLAAAFDLCFAVLQRWNRGRMLHLMEKQARQR